MRIVRALTQTQTLSKHCFSSVLGLFLNQGCPLCNRSGQPIFCIDCNRQLQDTYHLPTAWQAENSLSENAGWPVATLGHYEGALKQSIRSLKYQRRPEIAKVLGHAFGHQWTVLRDQLTSYSAKSPVYVLPIPLHSNRYQQRGYNQAELIAEAFCRTSGLPMLSQGLVRIEDTLPQYQLSLNSRQENLQGAFAVGRSLLRLRQPHKDSPKVLLIDDIYTTGATMRSATEVLACAGIDVVGVLAIARAVSS